SGIVLLRYNPPGTFGDSGALRYLSVALRFSWYVSVTIILIYIGNLSEKQLPRAAIVRWLSVLCVATVVGGLLGVLWPKFGFTSPLRRGAAQPHRREQLRTKPRASERGAGPGGARVRLAPPRRPVRVRQPVGRQPVHAARLVRRGLVGLRRDQAALVRGRGA